MNSTQIQTTAAPLVAFLAGLLAGKGVFGLDAATWATIIGSVAALGATIWGAIAATKKGVAASAASYADTKVITDGATAAAITNNDVMSNSEVKVVPR